MLLFGGRLLAITMIFVLFPGAAVYVDAAALSCEKSPVIFSCDNDSDFKCLCSTANAALDFLSSIGLVTRDCISVRLVEHISSNSDHTLIGQYDPVLREVRLLTYAKVIELVDLNKLMPGIAMSDELWCSYAAHELAHVISCKYLSSHIKAHTAGEYISAVTQLSVLSPRVRKEILNRYADIEAYHSRSEMSELYFLMDPNKFAVKCYKHFITLDNPKGFIDMLVREGNGY